VAKPYQGFDRAVVALGWVFLWMAVLPLARASSASAQVVTFEDFESHANDAALAAAWPAVVSSPIQTLETASPIEAAQSMRVAYDVTDGSFSDAVQFTFSSDQDFTLFTTLRIFYHVEPGSSVEDIVVELLDSADVVLGSKVAPGGTGVTDARWETSVFLGFLKPNQDLQQVRKLRLTIRDKGDMAGTGAVVFDDMSVSSGTYSTCRPCHGEFNDNPYVSLADGQIWTMGLHGTHVDVMLNGDCLTCHFASSNFPVVVDRSDGGVGLPPVSCMGCHGREEDKGNDAISPGRGAGLRQHHVGAGVAACGPLCHSDGVAQSVAVAGENVLPPFYFLPDAAHPAKPADACSGSERFVSTMFGLDNDGDQRYERADPDCVVFAAPAPVVGLPGLLGAVAFLFGIGAWRLRSDSKSARRVKR
jgi:hypothetical protein